MKITNGPRYVLENRRYQKRKSDFDTWEFIQKSEMKTKMKTKSIPKPEKLRRCTQNIGSNCCKNCGLCSQDYSETMCDICGIPYGYGMISSELFNSFLLSSMLIMLVSIFYLYLQL